MTREQAIKILRKEIECLSHSKCEDCILEKVCDPMITTPLDTEYIEAYGMAISALSENKGEWQHDGSHWKNRFICSECGYKLFDEPTNFCPNCGAKMKGGE